jgi:hypothetical protein
VNRTSVPRGRLAIVVAAFLLAVLASCMSSRLAPHDQTIADGLAALQVRHTQFFDQLQQTAGTPDAAWECHQDWYEETRAQVAALRTRAASYGLASDPTGQALDLLDRSLDELEAAHAKGLSGGEIPVLRTLFDSQFRMLIQLEAGKRPAVAEVTP